MSNSFFYPDITEFYNICKTNNIKNLIEIYPQLNKKDYTHLLGNGILYACEFGNIEIFNYIYVNSKWVVGDHPATYTDCLLKTCENGHYELTKILLSIGKPDQIWWGMIFRYACSGGNLKIIKLITRQNKVDDYTPGVIGACQTNNMKLMRFLIKYKYINLNIWFTLNQSFTSACFGGHLFLAKRLIKRGADNFEHGIRSALSRRHFKVIKFLRTKGTELDYNTHYANGPVENKDYKRYLIEKGLLKIYCKLRLHRVIRKDMNSELEKYVTYKCIRKVKKS